MNKFIVMVVGISSLFGQSYLPQVTNAQKSHINTSDEIEMMVNSLLSLPTTLEHYQPIQKSTFDEGKYFVQIAAYSKIKPTTLISKIEKSGYQTVVHSVFRKNKHISLVLVGPYKSRDEVKQQLSTLKLFEKDAFIIAPK